MGGKLVSEGLYIRQSERKQTRARLPYAHSSCVLGNSSETKAIMLSSRPFVVCQTVPCEFEEASSASLDVSSNDKLQHAFCYSAPDRSNGAKTNKKMTCAASAESRLQNLRRMRAVQGDVVMYRGNGMRSSLSFTVYEELNTGTIF